MVQGWVVVQVGKIVHASCLDVDQSCDQVLFAGCATLLYQVVQLIQQLLEVHFGCVSARRIRFLVETCLP